jgi:pimeloyl-ACP methyl ester carboxylesterase
MNTASDPEIGQTIEANGIATNYLESGQGDPLILLHGSGPGVTAYANWRLVIPKLSQAFRVLAPDIVGFGYTERPKGASYNMDYWLKHALGFLDALGIARARFIGNSFGGALTLALAARYPDRIERFILMGAAGVEFEITPGLDEVWGYQPSLASMVRMMDLLAYNKNLVTSDLIESRYRASIRPGYQESFSKLFPAPRQRHITALATHEDQIRKIDKRVLLVHGRDDQVVPPCTSQKLHKLLANSDLVMVGNCGHWVQMEQHKKFCLLAEAFLLGNMD